MRKNMSEYYVFENISANDEGDGGLFETNAPKEMLLKAYKYADVSYYEEDGCWEDSLHHYLNKRGFTIKDFEPAFVLYNGGE